MRQSGNVGQPQTTSEAGRSLDKISNDNINGNIPTTSGSINSRQGWGSLNDAGSSVGSQSLRDGQVDTGVSNVVHDSVQGSQQILRNFEAPLTVGAAEKESGTATASQSTPDLVVDVQA